MRSQVYPPAPIEVSNHRADIIEGPCIRVETTIIRDVDDREVLWPQAGRTSLTSGVHSTRTDEKDMMDDMSNVDFSGVGWDSDNSYP